MSQHGYREGTELAVIQGSTPAEEREDIRAEFTAPPDKQPVRVLVATDSAGEGIDLQDHCHRLVNFDIPFNPSRLEQRIGRIDRYGQKLTPEIYQLSPAGNGSAYARDLKFLLDKVRQKIGTVAADLGSANEVIDVEIQDHFTPGGTGRKVRLSARDDGNVIINRALAGGMELNRALTELSRTYGERKAEMHLTPANALRVVDTALELTGQPPLRPVEGDDPAEVFEVPALGPAWQSALRGLETRLNPGVLRPVTFDEQVARGGDDEEEGRDDLVYIHLGHALLQRSARILRSALFNVDSPVHRVTAVVVEELPQSCVAAVSRLVLVGLGGLRLHEEVFLTGIRIRGQAMSEAKVEEVLDTALDAQDLVLADADVRRELADLWNGDGTSAAHPPADRDGAEGQDTPGEGDRRAAQAAGHRHRPGTGDLRRVPRQPAGVARPAGPGDPQRGGEAVPRRPAAAAAPRPRVDDRPPGQPGRRGAAGDRRHQRPLRRHQAARDRGGRRVRADPGRRQGREDPDEPPPFRAIRR